MRRGFLVAATCLLLKEDTSALNPMSQSAGAAAASCANKVTLSGAGSKIVNGVFVLRPPAIIPAAFDLVCKKYRWNTNNMWMQLNGDANWWEADNGSYIYLNQGDGKWWIDSGETGLGLYISTARNHERVGSPPLEGWETLTDGELPLPTITFDA